MGLFGKLFGRSNNEENKTIDIENLLSSEDINDSIIKLEEHISNICNHGDNIEKLNKSQRVFFLNQKFEMEMNNGGFDQFYFNSVGDFADEIIDTLRAINANKTADLVLKANEQFPESKVPNDRDERQEIMEKIEESIEGPWNELDTKFYNYEDDLNSLNIEFIRKNRTDFN